MNPYIDWSRLESQMALTQEILPKTDEKVARRLLDEVDGLLDQARNGRESLQRTYVEIGAALLKVEQTKAWMSGGFHSFEAYIKSCEVRFGRARTQLFGYKAVAERLLPEVSKEQLIEMGISRAMPLAMYVKKTGKPAANLLRDALNPKVGAEQFEALVAEATHQTPEKGKWHQLSLKAEDSEWGEIKRAMSVALSRATDGVPLPPETSEPLKNKISLLALAAEFLSTYSE